MPGRPAQFVRTLALLSVPAVLASATFLWLLLLRPLDDRLEQAALEEQHRPVVEEVLARTLREIQSGVTEVKVVAPPFAQPDPKDFPANGPSDIPTPRSRPIPPLGYEFVSHQGTMLRAPLTAQDAREPTANPAWLDPATAFEELKRQAKSAHRDWTFAAARLARGAQRAELAQSLAALGAGLEGITGEYARIRVPANFGTLKAINDLPQVLGLGAMPAALKAPPEFTEQAMSHPPGELVPAFITLMADDPSGEWRQPLASLGVTVGAYDSDLRAYTANMPYGALPALLQADFVMAVEPIAIVQAAHDTSVPAIGADALRQYQHATSQFTGLTGQGVPIGVMDTGLNIRHLDISSDRDSICGANFVQGEDWDLWLDTGGHGTHVTATLAGAGRANPLFAGVAPNANHIRFAKVLTWSGFNDDPIVHRGMDFLAVPSGCNWKGQATAQVKPLIVNLSLERRPRSDSYNSERKLDSVVYAHGQLYVVSQADSQYFVPSAYATAKNSLAVGAVDDAGIIASSSGRGPTTDNRLAPSLVGVGISVISAAGAGRATGYVADSGTSMAAPSVAGVAALLMEAESDFHEQPALARARLMASAIRPDAFLDGPDEFPRNNTGGPGRLQNQYGLGLVSAQASVLSRDTEQGWVLGSATSEPSSGSYEYVDIQVPEGASRLDIVMTWDEQPSDTLSGSVLNNLDLWVDEGADCTAEPCGEYSSKSTRDNIEWLFIDSPAPGTHRIKVAPRRLFGETVKAAIAWTIIRGDAQPRLSVTVKESSITSTAGEFFEVDLSVSTDQYLASGVTLHADWATESGSLHHLGSALQRRESEVIRMDGLARDLSADNLYRWIPLGELALGEERRVRLKFLPSSSFPSHKLYLTASAWNAHADTVRVDIGPDEMSASQPSEESNADSTTPSEYRSPANDDFANASAIEGESGSASIVFVGASREPGEAHVTGNSRTLWHTWTAPSDGLHRFRLANAESGTPFRARMNLYIGDTLVSLVRTADKRGSELSFSAEQGVVYSLQVESTSSGQRPVTLQWERADVRPANDDFFYAQEIPSEAGSVSGGNEGATLEQSEFWGGLAATVWYRWTAPSDGHWIFGLESGRASFMVFRGDALSNLRLVSDPSVTSSVSFPAASGETYYIALAAGGAGASGTQFEFSWKTTERAGSSLGLASNDQFEDAQVLEGAEGDAEANWAPKRTVQPGEPAQTGIGTMWWEWTAPEKGTYTWHFGSLPELLYSVFTGETVNELTLVGQGRVGTPMTFDAQASTTYFVALAQSQDSVNEYVRDIEMISWGKTPANDDRGSATQLAGATGSVSANLKYATAQQDEPSDTVGYESLWWNWSASASGWYRFWVEDNPLSVIISIYPADGVGGALSTPVASSERSFVASGRVEAHVLARAGSRYAFRLARRPRVDLGAPHSLRWESLATNPAFLAYSGVANNATLKNAELPHPIFDVRSFALSPDGMRLFATSDNRVLMFGRDPADGSLSILDRYDRDENSPAELGNNHLNWAQLRWDPKHNQLIADTRLDYGVFAFTLSSDRNSLEYAGKITIHGNLGYASERSLGLTHADREGNFVYALNEEPAVVRVFRVDSAQAWTLVQTIRDKTANREDELLVPAMHFPRDLTFSSDDSHVYLAARDALLVFSKDASTGKLTLASEIARTESPDTNQFEGLGWPYSTELDESGGYLFVGGRSAPSVAVFDVSTDSARPRFLDSVTRFYIDIDGGERVVWTANYHLIPKNLGACGLAVRHSELHAVDYVCEQGYYVVRWDAASEKLHVTDWGRAGQSDRYGAILPNVLQNYRAESEQSHDGKYLYAFGSGQAFQDRDSIHIFQRAGSITVDTSGNHAPALNQLLVDQAAKVGEAFSYQVPESTFTDADMDSLTYVATGAPTWLTFTAATRTFSGTPQSEDETFTAVIVTVTASDASGASASTRFALEVEPADADRNSPPLTSRELINQSVRAAEAFSYQFAADTFTDPDGDSLTYSATGMPTWLSFTPATRTFSGTPTAADVTATALSITVTATDPEGASNRSSFQLTVLAASVTPDTSPAFPTTGTPGDQTYTVGTAISTLALPTATGGDGTLAYSLSPAVPGLSFDTTTRQLTGTPTTAGTHAMTYTVTDADGDSDSLSFTITVQEGDGEMETDLVDCYVGLLVHPGQSCTYPGTEDAFSVGADGRGMFLIITSARAININKVTYMGTYYDFRAEHEGDGIWRIDRLDGSTTPTH